jgi:hypothetical protein
LIGRTCSCRAGCGPTSGESTALSTAICGPTHQASQRLYLR